MNQRQAAMAAAAAAIERCEMADAACDQARAALELAAPGEAFAAAWGDYRRLCAAFEFAHAEVRVALEDAAAIP